jgi:hypothetical protein
MFYHEDGTADSSRNFAKCLPDNTGEHPGRPQLHISTASISLNTQLRVCVPMRRSYAGYVFTPPNPSAKVSFRTRLMILANSTKKRESLSREVAYPR